MPLTYVVTHLNQQLKDLHSNSKLQKFSTLIFEDNKIRGQINDLYLQPHQTPVFDVSTSKPVASDTALVIKNKQGTPVSSNQLYIQAWDAADIIFLDRFLRTLHALHHINLQREKSSKLILDVHFRHISSVPSHHGEVFEQLLSNLGLTPNDIILRINIDGILSSQHAMIATDSFVERGYTLLAVVNDTKEETLHDLQELGISWVTIDNSSIQQNKTKHPQAFLSELKLWHLKATLLDLKTLAPKISSNQDMNLALNARFDLLGGRLLAPELPEKAISMNHIGRILAKKHPADADISLGI